MDKPGVCKHLDWIEIDRWFAKTYPGQYDHEVISEWVSNDRTTHNGELVGVDNDILSHEEEPDLYDEIDPKVLWFVETLYREFPEAADEYGRISMHFWW
jgi:hypothetical protein